jgi:hypothetical protein
MSAAIALVLLAETTTTCAPGGASRLGGHAILVRPVGTFDPVPFERLGPAPAIVIKPSDMQWVAATPTDDEPERSPPAHPCEMPGIAIA